MSRQIGLALDRQGRVSMVIVGDASSILIPELPHARTGAGRLRGLRLLHTHLGSEGLSHEDLMDLLFLRLDSVSVLTVDEWGQPGMCQSAHLMPPAPGQEDSGYAVGDMLSWDRVDIDFTRQAEMLEEEFGRVLDDAVSTGEEEEGERAVLVSVSLAPRAVQERHLAELAELARTAGVKVTGSMIQRVAAIHPRHILGRSKLAELEVLALQGQATLVIFDGELSPAQLNSLSELTERRVMDRTQLILDIFAGHAVTKAGKLQVEMAQLQYSLPRLAGKHRSMDRLAGGIFGNKGRGETKLELERRRIRERITRIRKDLEELRRQRFHTRARRARQGLPLAALVGYTNAGKSTLLNALTKADVLAENKLFATLDPTTRRLRFPKERELVLADTVGFIRSLPRELMEAFRATLEELEAADLLIHVVDASHPERDQQMESVERILAEMGLQHIPRVTLLNKWDAVPVNDRVPLLLDRPEAIPVSALAGTGLQKAAAAIERQMFDEGAWQRRDPQTWEEFEKKGRVRKRRADEEIILDDTEPFR
ncbi:GTPase HflX [Mailhella massiliensis]|uniref:GTPase HflX n=1 Tax=Mailhella massiliensis TaxID=1903261 RepID=A0A921AU04_9BACT|nr:GTPase HflX [Mailhella massiliensis]HJD96372.1 GTPase HflX [Mailhella massiliensis]